MRLRQLGSNMAEVRLNSGFVVLFSYETPVAAWIEGEGFYKTEKKWSVTTSKHINKWLANADAKLVRQSWLDNLIKDEIYETPTY